MVHIRVLLRYYSSFTGSFPTTSFPTFKSNAPIVRDEVCESSFFVSYVIPFQASLVQHQPFFNHLHKVCFFVFCCNTEVFYT